MPVRCLRLLRRATLTLGFAMAAFAAHALTPEQTRGLAVGENDERIAALNASLSRGDAGLAEFVQAMLDGKVVFTADRVLVVDGDAVTDAATGAAVPLPDGAEEVINSNQMRRELGGALAAVNLFSDDLGARRAAAQALKDEADEAAR